MVERERERIGDYGGEWARCLLQDSVERVLAIYRSVIDTSYLYTRLLAYLLLISLSLSLSFSFSTSHTLSPYSFHHTITISPPNSPPYSPPYSLYIYIILSATTLHSLSLYHTLSPTITPNTLFLLYSPLSHAQVRYLAFT